LIVVAAGKSSRLKSATPKPFLTLSPGTSMLEASLAVFARVPLLRYAVVATRKEYLDKAFRMLSRRGIPGRVVEGGSEREDSVARALLAMPPGIPLVLVHDAARPFVTHRVIQNVLSGAARWGAVVPGVKVTDTIKLYKPGGAVQATLPRHRLAAVQTPQGFKTDLLRNAFRKVGKKRSALTDDGAVAQAAGYPVRLVVGDIHNFKITTKADLIRARGLFRR